MLAKASAIQPSTARWVSRCCALGLVVSGVCFASHAHAQDIGKTTIDMPDVVPAAAADDRPTSGTNGTLMLTGAAVFAGWYGVAVGESFMWPDAPEADKLRIPVVGPWFAVAKAGCGPEEVNCGDVLPVVRAILEAVTAVAQVGGLAVMAEGAFLRTDAPAPAKPAKPKAFQGVTVVADGNRFGVGVFGAF